MWREGEAREKCEAYSPQSSYSKPMVEAGLLTGRMPVSCRLINTQQHRKHCVAYVSEMNTICCYLTDKQYRYMNS